MANGDSKPGAGAPPKAQEKVEKPGMEQLNENYFKRVNEEFEKMVKEKPEEFINTKLIDDISKRNEASFEKKVVDGLKKPDEAFTWGGNMLKVYAGSWIAEITGLKKYVGVLKDKINGLIEKGKTWLGEKTKGVKGKLEGLKKKWGFGEKEEDQGKAPEAEIAPEGEGDIETIPLSEAGKEMLEGLSYYLSPLHEKIVAHPKAAAIIAAWVSLKHFDQLQSGAGLGLDVVQWLALLPLKAVGATRRHPLTAVMIVSAVLMNKDRVPEISQMRVPKDKKNFKKYIIRELKKSREWMSRHHIPEIPEPEIDLAAAVMSGEKKMNEVMESSEQFMDNILQAVFELASSNPEKLLRGVNRTGLEAFQVAVKNFRYEAGKDSEEGKKYGELLSTLESVVKELAEGRPLNSSHIEELKAKASPVGFSIYEQNGFFLWKKEAGGVLQMRVRQLAVDPKLSPREAFERAQEFVVDPHSYWAAGARYLEVPFEQGRLFLGDIRENVKAIESLAPRLAKWLGEGKVLVWAIGTEIVVTDLYGVKKYLTMPFELIGKVLLAACGKYDLSETELALDHQEGMLAIACLSATRLVPSLVADNVLRLDIRGLLTDFVTLIPKVAIHAVTSPFSSSKVVGKHIVWPLLRGDVRGVLANPRLQFQSGMKARMAHAQASARRILPGTDKTIGAMNRKEAHLWDALHALYQGVDSLLLQGHHLDTAKAHLQKAEVSHLQIEIGDNAKTANDAIAKILSMLEHLDRKIRLLKIKPPGFEKEIQEIDALLKGEKKPASVEALRQEPPKEAAGHDEKAGAELERLKKITAYDQKIRQLEKERDGLIQRTVDDATRKGTPLSHPEVQGKLQEARTHFEKKIAEIWILKTPLLRPEERIPGKRGGPDMERRAPEVPSRSPGAPEVKPPRLGRRIGGGALRLGGAVGLGLGLGKAFQYLEGGEEEFSVEKVYGAVKEKPIVQERDEDKEKRIVMSLKEYLQGFDRTVYQDFYQYLTYENLKNHTETSLQALVNNGAKEHGKVMERVKAFFAIPENAEFLFRYYDRFSRLNSEEVKKPMALNQYCSIAYNPKEKLVILHSASEDDFKEAVLEYADCVYRNEGKPVTTTTMIEDGVLYAAPLTGIGMDARDTYYAVRRGQVKKALWSGLMTVVDVATDAALFTGFLAPASGAVKAGKLAAISARAASLAQKVHQIKVMEKLAANSGKIFFSGLVLDVSRVLFIPKHSEQIVLTRGSEFPPTFEAHTVPGDIAGQRR